jgi:dihydropteroate synthase
MSGAFRLRCRGVDIDAGRPLVMGVVNATPDSFSDGAEMANRPTQFARVDELVAAGADILDIGGQSAITGVPEISVDEEIERITPVVERAVAAGAIVSVDTYRADVADAALSLGAHIINDISALKDPRMAEVLASRGAGYVLMHNPGRPKVRLTETNLYDDVVDAVVEFWTEGLDRLRSAGVADEAVILDFGPDFAKTPHQTLQCLRGWERLAGFRRPLLMALSRKDFIGTALRLVPRERDEATLAAMVWIASKVPSVIARTHRPLELRQAFDMLGFLDGRADLHPDDRLDPSLRRQGVTPST